MASFEVPLRMPSSFDARELRRSSASRSMAEESSGARAPSSAASDFPGTEKDILDAEVRSLSFSSLSSVLAPDPESSAPAPRPASPAPDSQALISSRSSL